MADPMSIDRSLDEIIKNNRSSRGGRGGLGRRRGGRRGGGGVGGGGVGGGSMAAARTIQKPQRSNNSMEVDRVEKWQHDKFLADKRGGSGGGGGGGGGGRIVGRLATGAKIIVSNLDYNVTNADINDLFAGVGKLKQAFVKFDRQGRSSGQAEVVFTDKADALEAIKRYNGVPLDDRPLKISLSTTHTTEGPIQAEAALAATERGDEGGGRGGGRRRRGGRGRGAGAADAGGKDLAMDTGDGAGASAGGGGGRGGGGGASGRADGGGRYERKTMTKEELDAQLDAMASGKMHD